MNNVLALINLYPDHNLGYLTENRPMASTTLLARYAFIDFALSNFSNSNIDTIGIMVKDHANSIYKHIGSSKTYLSNTRTGMMNFLINERGLINPVFNTDLNNIRENDYILYDKSKEYVIISNVYFLMKMDYSKVIEEHIKNGHKVSLLYKKVDDTSDFVNAKKVIADNLGNAQKIYYDDKKDSANILLDTMVIDRQFFLDIISNSDVLGDLATMNDLETYLLNYVHDGIKLIEFTGQVIFADSFEKYFKYSINILGNNELLNFLFKDNSWRFYTTTHNMSPVQYGEKAKVSNSLIGNGCVINGTVKNCILARDVFVEEGAVLENCIIFSHSYVKSGIKLKNLVADKRVRFEYKNEIEGTFEKPLYFPRGTKA